MQDGKTALQVALEKAQDASRQSHGHAPTTSTSSFEEICIKLIEAGSDITAVTTIQICFARILVWITFFMIHEQAGDTLLSLAVGAGFERVVTMLLQRGADVNWVDTKVWETITI